MIHSFMLPARLPFVKTAPAASSCHGRVRRPMLFAMVMVGVLSAHALLLGLLWKGQASHKTEQIRSAQAITLVTVNVLTPTRATTAAPAPTHSRPRVHDTLASHPPQTAQPHAPSSLPREPGQTATTAATPGPVSKPAAASPDATPVASDTPAAATHPSSQPHGNGAKTSAVPATNTTSPRIELPDAGADYLDNPRPAYPPMSRRLGEQGQVLLRVWVETDGRAGKVEIRQSSGFERLDRAALQTVQRWRFVPGKRAGVPEAMWADIPLQFVLE